MIKKQQFHSRGKEILRIEALSDAVFAFSVSLLVVSLEVPQTFTELKYIVTGALPFFATVAVLFLLWYRQYIFFRRYGLNDLTVIILNMAYLATVIFYIYPLKFMFSLLLSNWTGFDYFPKASLRGEPAILQHEFNQLIILFSAGYAIVWLLLYLMHKRAMRLAGQLQFSQYEKLYTAKELRGAIMNSILGMVAVLFALFNWNRIAGITYLLIPLLLLINHRVFMKQNRKLVHA